MALAELVLALEREAEARIAAVRAEAAAEAAQVRAAAQGQLARRRSADLVAREQELQAVATVRLDAARRAAAMRTLTARAKALEAIRAQALGQLAAILPEAGMQEGLTRDLDAALECFGVTEVIIICRPDWAPALKVASAGRSGIRLEERAELGPGLIARAADGRIELDATLEGRLTRLWPALEIELLRELASPA